MELLRPILVQNYFPWETEKRQIGCAACRHSSEDCLPKSKSIRKVNPLLKNLNLNSVLQKATRCRRLKLHCWAMRLVWTKPPYSVFSLFILDVIYSCSVVRYSCYLQFESGTALLRDKADEGYHSWNRALLTISRPWSLHPNLLPIWEHPQWVGKRDRGSHQSNIKPGRFSYQLPVH